jgi:hypothetical protein
VQRSGTATIGVVGVIWPAMRWLDEPLVAPGGAAGARAGAGIGGGVASVGGMAPANTESPIDPTGAESVRALKAVYAAPDQQASLEELARLLEERPADSQALRRFQQLLEPLTRTPDAVQAPEDNGEAALLKDDPRQIYERFADATPLPDTGGGTAAGGNPFEALWTGAREALRQATYWQMKRRAGQVGQHGVGPLVGRLHQRHDALRIHLAGHSFGARVAAFTLSGLPPDGVSPAKSLLLLQGAFSHFAFAAALPDEPGTPGALAGMQSRVDGPLLVTHSQRDTALTTAYPLASIVSGDATAAAQDLLFRWRAMGDDGAQSVPANKILLAPVGTSFPISPGAIINLDGNEIITVGDPPGGAHGDIFRPEIAWAALLGAGLVRGA